jgi:hypothetical protein
MKWHLATDEQLETIFNSDDHCPNHLLVGVVEEMMKRDMFGGMIMTKAKQLETKINRGEVVQAAHIGIFQLAKIYKPGKLPFKNLCYIVIERRIKTLQQKRFYKNNFANAQALQNEVPEIESSFNVERAVIRKVIIQEKLSRLSEKQRVIVDLFLKGYPLKWIGENVYNQDTSAIRYQFKLALQKMNVEDYKIGTRTGLKGA